MLGSWRFAGRSHSSVKQPTQPRQSNAFSAYLKGNGGQENPPAAKAVKLWNYTNTTMTRTNRVLPPPSTSPSAPASRLSRIRCSADSILAATAPVWILPNQAAAACAGAQNLLTLTSQSQACQIGGLWASVILGVALASKNDPRGRWAVGARFRRYLSSWGHAAKPGCETPR